MRLMQANQAEYVPPCRTLFLSIFGIQPTEILLKMEDGKLNLLPYQEDGIAEQQFAIVPEGPKNGIVYQVHNLTAP
jgi:hypothetical protein